MLSSRLSLLCSSWLLCLLLCLWLSPASGAPQDPAMPPRPTRPERFNTQEEVNEYVRKLQEYYSVIGRGRYGKRTFYLYPQMPVIPQRYLPLPDRIQNDLYEILTRYQ